jgi:putative membrane protein
MMWGNGTGGWGMSGWGMALMLMGNLLFWGLLITGIVLAVRYAGPGTPVRPGGRPPTPQEVLANRFARGEIDEDEYARRMQVLNGGP